MALMIAAEHGHLDVVNQLLEAGAGKDLLNQVRPKGQWGRRRAARRGAWGAAGLRGGLRQLRGLRGVRGARGASVGLIRF